MKNDPQEWKNLAADPAHAAIISEHKKWLPKTELPAAPKSAHRILTYDSSNDEAIWEGTTIQRSDPVPE
jgi:hypothetical protein